MLNEIEQHYWDAYVSSLPEAERPQSPVVIASMAGDERLADHLLELYLSGRKHAGSGLVEEYRQDGEPLPEVGDYWIILDAAGQPKCIARTERVEIHAFKDITAEIAEAEGEGDRSLSDWRARHQWFYIPQLERLGITDLEQTEVVTEFFVIVAPAQPARQLR